MSPWERFISKPQARGHFVQFCEPDDKTSLVRNVSLYISEGLKCGDGVLLITTAENRDAFVRELGRLGVDTLSALDEKHLVCADAQDTLACFMVAGQPAWDKFETAVRRAMLEVRPARDQSALRAYGEMVGLLWSARQFSAAIRLEQFWNKLLARSSFNLYCAYSIDVSDRESQIQALDRVLSTHTHLIPNHTSKQSESCHSLQPSIDEILGMR